MSTLLVYILNYRRLLPPVFIPPVPLLKMLKYLI